MRSHTHTHTHVYIFKQITLSLQTLAGVFDGSVILKRLCQTKLHFCSQNEKVRRDFIVPYPAAKLSDSGEKKVDKAAFSLHNLHLFAFNSWKVTQPLFLQVLLPLKGGQNCVLQQLFQSFAFKNGCYICLLNVKNAKVCLKPFRHLFFSPSSSVCTTISVIAVFMFCTILGVMEKQPLTRP